MLVKVRNREDRCFLIRGMSWCRQHVIAIRILRLRIPYGLNEIDVLWIFQCRFENIFLDIVQHTPAGATFRVRVEWLDQDHQCRVHCACQAVSYFRGFRFQSVFYI